MPTKIEWSADSPYNRELDVFPHSDTDQDAVAPDEVLCFSVEYQQEVPYMNAPGTCAVVIYEAHFLHGRRVAVDFVERTPHPI